MAQQTVPKPIACYTRVSEQGDRADEELRSHEIQRGKVGMQIDDQFIVLTL